MENPLTIKMIKYLDLLMKVNVILCIMGVLALKTGMLDRLGSTNTATQVKPVSRVEAGIGR